MFESTSDIMPSDSKDMRQLQEVSSQDAVASDTASVSAVPVGAEKEEMHTEAANADLGPGVTPRVVMLCLALAVMFGYIIPIIDRKLSNTFLGATHLPPGAIAVLLVLLLVVNPLLRFISQRPGRLGRGLSRNEILTTYISCLFSALVPGHGAENFFVSNLIGSFYYASLENKWLSYLTPYLPSWFTPALKPGGAYNAKVVEDWYTGLRANESIPWAAWLTPLLVWGALVFVSYFMIGCIAVMLRAQWAGREALAFPMLRLPLQLTEDVDRTDRYGTLSHFFRNPLMWIGFGIAAFIQLLNGFNFYFPDVPMVPLSLDTSLLFTELPWNQIGNTPIRLWPIAIGISYLLTTEISFSFWFFFWFMKGQLIAAYYLGYPPGTLPGLLGSGAKAFTGYQQIGATLAYVAIVLWTAREHLQHVVRRAFGRAPAHDDEKSEALPYPIAFWGFVLSFCFLVGWSVVAGMRADVAFALWLTYVVIVVALGRVMVEGGLLFVNHGWTPLGAIGQLVGAGPDTWLAPSSLVPGSFIQAGLMTDMRASLMPSFIQSLKLAHDRKIRAGPLLLLIFAVVAITFMMSLWMNVRLGYQHGGLQLNLYFAINGSRNPARHIEALINGARDASSVNWLWLGLGALLTYGMVLARSRLLWFPLHPLGLLICQAYPIQILWCSILVGWAFKVLITRFGGSETYRKMVPAFLGLALGDVVMMLFWLIVDGWQGRTLHQLMPP